MNISTMWIIGGGGHAKVAIAAAEAAGIGIAAIFDDDASKQGQDIIGYRITGAIPDTAWWRGADIGALVAIGDGRVRQRIVARCPAHWRSLIHPTAWVHASASVGVGVLICAGAIVQPDAIIGAHAIINTGAIIEHDCKVGAYAHIAPRACLAGGASVGEGTLVGAGAVVSPAGKVGDWSIIGAGSVVLGEVGDGVTMVGVPARPLG